MPSIENSIVGVFVYIEKRGRGTPLVMLHGWGMNSLVWQPLLPYLERHFCLYMVDLPGFGNSPLPDSDALDYFCDWAETHLPVNAHWLGWSMGGLYMLAFAQRCPNHPASLCLLASNPKFVATADWSGVEAKVFEQFSHQLASNIDKTIERFLAIQAMGAPHARAQIKQLKALLGVTPRASSTALQAGLALLKNGDLRQMLCELEIPLFAIFGERDRLVPPQLLTELSSHYPQLQASIVTASGHAPFISSPELVSAQLLTWYRAIAS